MNNLRKGEKLSTYRYIVSNVIYARKNLIRDSENPVCYDKRCHFVNKRWSRIGNLQAFLALRVVVSWKETVATFLGFLALKFKMTFYAAAILNKPKRFISRCLLVVRHLMTSYTAYETECRIDTSFT